jgi:hypothetical protein
MRRIIFGVLLLLILGFSAPLRAQEGMIPAGTLLRCILDEPRLSPSSAETGDPIICRLSYNRIGGVTLPPGSYLGGHVDAEKRLGNFSTHGSMKLVFDRLGTSSRTLPMPSKVIAVQNHSVNREGEIIGGWLSDPVLKPETVITLRLMEDVSIPNARVSLGVGWHFFDEGRSR